MRIQRQEEEIQQSTNSNENINTVPALRAVEQAPPSYDGSKESVISFYINYLLLITTMSSRRTGT